MQRIHIFTVCLLVMVGISGVAAHAQVQTDKHMNASSSTFKPRRLADLQGAAQSIQKEILEEINREFNKCLPTKIGTFEPYEDENSYMQSGTLAADPLTGMAFFKSYRDSGGSAGSKVVVSIIANSPMVSSLTMFLSNPMIARDTGKKSTTYNGFKAIEEYDPVYRTGEINLLLSDNTLVTISATDVPDGKLLAEFAKAINYRRILNIIE